MSFSICRVQWEIAAPLLQQVREKVFICEWRIPAKIEFDHCDLQAYHILVCDDQSQEPVATGRILPSGEISRIAVLITHRKQALDKIVLKCLLDIANELGLDDIFINSPLDHVNYFINKGFYIAGSVFMEAGMPRQRMACKVDQVELVSCYLTH